MAENEQPPQMESTTTTDGNIEKANDDVEMANEQPSQVESTATIDVNAEKTNDEV
jgi:hypothetical protein